eukprot:CAMPEP_0194479300 /NCGR_PEP_ID=MMETSP0253-20130528/2470_1 /TAXON_ID=2966 /ORGANISM="Noctiluca scintillans" /LENGTH=48 /DNA_ID= /DNA_START= /DNA_END= /DNA_ORIENTATION=
MGAVCGLNPVPAIDFRRSDVDEPASFFPSSFSRRNGTPCMKKFKELSV